MKDKIPFSTLLIAIGMKLASVGFYAVADIVEDLKVLDSISSILNLCGKLFNVSFWILAVIFICRIIRFIFAKIRKNKADLKQQIAEEKAQAVKDAAALEATKQGVVTTTDYMGRQAKGF